MSFIEIRDLEKLYIQGEEKIYAVNHLNLDIQEGEFFVILGPSGSGKSTLLNIIGGLDTSTSGKVIVNGRDISSLSDAELADYRRKTIGFVFQNFNLLPTLSVEENIVMPILMDGRDVKLERLHEIEESLDIKNLTKRYPSQISGGQQQRVAIARALANEPSIILADEPTGNLDADTSKKVLELLVGTCKRFHKTLVMITHNEEIAKLADKAVRIKDGKEYAVFKESF